MLYNLWPNHSLDMGKKKLVLLLDVLTWFITQHNNVRKKNSSPSPPILLSSDLMWGRRQVSRNIRLLSRILDYYLQIWWWYLRYIRKMTNILWFWVEKLSVYKKNRFFGDNKYTFCKYRAAMHIPCRFVKFWHESWYFAINDSIYYYGQDDNGDVLLKVII